MMWHTFLELIWKRLLYAAQVDDGETDDDGEEMGALLVWLEMKW